MASWDGDSGLFGKTYGDDLCRFAVEEMGGFPALDDIVMEEDWYQHMGDVILGTEFGDVHICEGKYNPAARAFIVLAEDEETIVAEVMVPCTDIDTGEYIGEEEAARRAWAELKDAVEWRSV